MLKEMYDYLSEVTPDYTTTELSVTPQDILEEEGEKTQKIHKFDDGSITVVDISSSVYFTVTLQWKYISETDSGTIVDLWNDTNKANGMKRTFYWQHPSDGHTYVARFLTPLKRGYIGNSKQHQINNVRLRIEGKKLDS